MGSQIPGEYCRRCPEFAAIDKQTGLCSKCILEAEKAAEVFIGRNLE